MANELPTHPTICYKGELSEVKPNLQVKAQTKVCLKDASYNLTQTMVNVHFKVVLALMIFFTFSLIIVNKVFRKHKLCKCILIEILITLTTVIKKN